MKSFLRIWEYLKPFKARISFNITFNIFSSLFGVFSFLMIIPFLDVLFYPLPGVPLERPAFNISTSGLKENLDYWLDHITRTQGKEAALVLICAIVFITTLLKNLFRYMALYIMTPAKNGIIYNLRKKLFRKITNLPVSFFSEKKKGDLITRSSSDLQTFEFSILNILEVFLKEPFNIIISLTFLLIISFKLTILALILLPVSGLLIGRLGKTLKMQSHSVQLHLSNLVSILEETISGMKIVKAFNAEPRQQEKFDKYHHQYYRESIRMQRRIYLASPLTETLGISVAVVILYIGSLLVFEGEGALMTPPTLMGYLLLFGQMINPFKTFSSAMYHVQKGNASLERIEKVLERDVKVRESPSPVLKSTLEKSIRYENVKFAYERAPVLSDINVTIPKGQLTALVGPSGSGKSTFADLLCRFYDVTGGQIYMDDINIKDMKLSSLRNMIGIVSQEPVLFHDTVRNNIAFGYEEASPEDIQNAARIANAEHFIEKMEQGYDTMIGERGVKLSGGEKQRLTIARAVLKNPPILIFDEATSSLDSESEKLVQDALYKLMENRTSIVIAHRLSTIQHADKILVMQDGRIIEQGSHEALMKNQGTYRKLVEMQAF